MKTRLARRLRRCAADRDRGFSLVEVTVAMVIVMVVFAALLAALLTGIASAKTEQDRAAANQLAADMVENLRVTDWKKLGFYSTDFATFPALHDGESVVVAEGTPAAERSDDPAPPPTQQVTVNKLAYDVTTWVTWAGSSAAAPNTGSTYAAKRIAVSVSWVSTGSTRTVTTTGLRTPTGKEMAPPVAGGGSASPVTVAGPSVTAAQTLTSSFGLSAALSVAIETPSTADYVKLTWLQGGTEQSIELLPDATRKYWSKPSDQLLAGAGPFTAGTFTFTFTAGRFSGETQSATSSVVFTAPGGASGFVISSSAVTSAIDPQAHVLDSSYRTTSVLTVAASTSDSVDSVTATYTLSGGAQVSLPLTGSGGTSWTATLPVGTGPFTAGSNTFQLSAKKGLATAAAAPAVVLSSPALGAIAVTQPSATPGFCEGPKRGDGLLADASELKTTVKNVNGSDTVTFEILNGAAAPLQAGSGVSAGSAGFTFKVVVPQGTPVTETGGQAVRITVSRADGATQVSNWTVPVQHKTGNC